MYTHSSAYTTGFTDACKTHYTIPVYASLPEHEPQGSTHEEDIKKLKVKILI